MIYLKGRKDYIASLVNILKKYNVDICVLKEETCDDSLYLTPDDIQNVIIAILGSGGIITVLSSYFKHSKKIFNIKRGKDGEVEMQLQNIKPKEFALFLKELKQYLEENTNI